MFGFYASLAAAALATVEARLQDQANQSAQQEAFEDHMAMLQRQARRHQSDVIDVEAREVPEALALPAPGQKKDSHD